MPEYHPNEHPGLIQAETPEDLGARATLLTQKHIDYIIDFSRVRMSDERMHLESLPTQFPRSTRLLSIADRLESMCSACTLSCDFTNCCMQKDDGDWQVVASDSFRMSGVYWAATALALLDTSISAFRDEVALVEWILSCYKPDKGCFAPNTHHDGNMLATLSAVQLMALMGRTDALDAEKIAACAPCFQHALLLHGICLACAGIRHMHVDHCLRSRRI